MSHPGKDWYESSDIYEEEAWNSESETLAHRWEFQRFFDLDLPKGSHVFDIGCGRGDFLAMARTRGYKVGGVDFNKKMIEIARRVYSLDSILSGNLEDIAPMDLPRKPDALTAFEVMEHLSDPNRFLQSCRNLLSDSGTLVISVPSFHRWPHWVNHAVDKPPHHLTLWSQSSLNSILEYNGFTVKKIWRKPLLTSDVMFQVVRAVPGAMRKGVLAKAMRGGCKLMSLSMASVGRLHPRSGEFTLAVAATKSNQT